MLSKFSKFYRPWTKFEIGWKTSPSSRKGINYIKYKPILVFIL
jgi:hypothetical protein